jgi:hypothetical protein
MLAFVSDLKKDFALDHIEPFLLMEVQVKRRPTLYQVGVFDEEQASGCFSGRNLEKYLAVSARMRFAKAILACAYDMNAFRRRDGWGVREGKVLQACDREKCGCGLEERTALHGFSYQWSMDNELCSLCAEIKLLWTCLERIATKSM